MAEEDGATPVSLLIATIGERDPESPSGVTGPVRTALECLPARVALLAHGGVADRAERTRERIGAELPGSEVQVLEIRAKNPALLEDLQRPVSMLLDQVDLPEDSDQIAVCTSSSTQQIALAVTLALLARRPHARFYQALDPDKEEAPHLRPYDPDAFWHVPELARGIEALSESRTLDATRLFDSRLSSRLPVSTSVRRPLRWALGIASAVSHADELRVDEAANAIRIDHMPEAAAEVMEKGRRLGAWYVSLKSGHASNPDWAVELCARSLRLQRTTGIAASLLAAATAAEVMVTIRLATEHSTDPDELAELHKEWLVRQGYVREAQLRPQASGRYRLEGWQDRWNLLGELEPSARSLVSRHDRPPDFVEARNKLAHRGQQPKEKHLRQAREFVSSACDAFGWTSPDDTPSSPKSLAAVAEALKPHLGLG